MSAELVCNVRKRLASGFQLDARLTMPLDPAMVLVLFGPSGAGKTTLLRLIAGLEAPDEGEILFAGRAWTALPPQRRRAGFLFQDYALFPHLTVAENVFYGAGRPRRDLLKSFGLDDLARRLPRTLSGGEQQRVALARALAAEPALLLLDEPLSALDAATRTRMRVRLRRDLMAAQIPAIVVTHDRTEALTLGDAMAVMIDGRIRQTGAVAEVFRKPADAEVAAAVGVENVLPARIIAREGGLAMLDLGAAHLQAVDDGVEGAVLASIRAEDIGLARDMGGETSVRNRLKGTIVSVTLEGPLARVELDCGFPVVALITAQSAADLNLGPGQRIVAVVKTTSVHLLPAP